MNVRFPGVVNAVAALAAVGRNRISPPLDNVIEAKPGKSTTGQTFAGHPTGPEIPAGTTAELMPPNTLPAMSISDALTVITA
jgi:hypothetical protein